MSSILIIHNIRSVHNVGALFRTADAVGIDKIIISGYSPSPLDRFGRVRSDMAKSALGAEQTVPWETSENIIETIKGLKSDGYTIIGLEQDGSKESLNVSVSAGILLYRVLDQ